MDSKTVTCKICNNNVAYPQNSFSIKNHQTLEDIYVCNDCKETADRVASKLPNMQIKTCAACSKKFIYPKQGTSFLSANAQLDICESCIEKASENKGLLEFRCYKCGEMFTMTPEHKEFRDNLFREKGMAVPEEYMCNDCAIGLTFRRRNDTSSIESKPATEAEDESKSTAVVETKPIQVVEEADVTEEYVNLINAFCNKIEEANRFLFDRDKYIDENNGKIKEHQEAISKLNKEKEEIVELFKQRLKVDVSANLANVVGQPSTIFEMKSLMDSITSRFIPKKSDKMNCINIGQRAAKFVIDSIAYHNKEIEKCKARNSNLTLDKSNTKNNLKKFLFESDEYKKYTSIRETFFTQNDYTKISPFNPSKQNSNDKILFGFSGHKEVAHKEMYAFVKANKSKMDYSPFDENECVVWYKKPIIDCLSDTANKYVIESNGEETENAIQSYLIRALNKSKIKEYDFVLMDPIANGKSFKELIALVSDRGHSIANKIYCDRTEISNALLQLSEKIKGINQKIKGYSSIYEYNRKKDDKIKTTIFVAYNFFDDYYDPNLIRPIFENADKCGITIFVISNKDYEKKKLLESISKYKVTKYNFADRIIGEPKSEYIDYKYVLVNDQIAPIPKQNNVSEWIESYLEILKEGVKLRNKYAEVANLPSYYSLDSTNGLHIPFAVNQSNQIVDFNIAVPLCYHAFISGQTGIGKSVMLQSIISGIIRGYHPDDVELWLVDYKAVEFIEYVKNTPPHIRLVGLDTSKEFTHSLIEKIEDVMNERKILFSQAGVQKIEEYKAKYGKNSISRIVLIIDEAHRLSQHISENENDRKSFENILSEYRALGLTVILSDQAFENSMKGITQKGRDQITVRVAMKNSIDEIKATLSIDNSYYQNDSIKNDINTLSSGDAMFRYDEEREDGSSFRHVDRIKGFLIDRNNDRAEIISQVKQLAVQQGFKQKDPWLIVAKDRSTIFDIKNPFENVSFEGDKPRKIDVVLGAPSSLDPFHHIELKRGRNSNLIMCGGNESINLSVTYFTAVTMAIKMNSKVFVLASEDRLDSEFKHYFNSTFGNNVFIAETMEDYNVALDKIQETDSSCLIIWIGIDEIIDDMQMYEPKPRETERSVNSNSAASSMSDIFALKNLLDDKMGVTASTSSAPMEFYDRSSEIFELIEKASSTSKFSFLVLDSMKEIVRKREINIDYFGHKFGYNISNDDSSRLFGTARTVEVDTELKSATVIYSDCGSYSVLRPYQMDEKYIDYFSKMIK